MIYESKEIANKSDYLEEYGSKDEPTENGESPKEGKLDTRKIENAIQAALDIRKFEIELFWKRANYFWLYNVSAFTAYFYVIASKNIEMKNVLVLLITSIGFFMSLCWVFIGKASKYWQENWEKNVDLLEDEYMGPLYKTTLKHDRKWRDLICPLKSYKFSVSKISQLLSSGIFLVWLLLFVNSISTIFQCFFVGEKIKAIIVLVVTLLLLGLLVICCRTSKAADELFSMKRIKIKDNG